MSLQSLYGNGWPQFRGWLQTAPGAKKQTLTTLRDKSVLRATRCCESVTTNKGSGLAFCFVVKRGHPSNFKIPRTCGGSDYDFIPFLFAHQAFTNR
jgi:hypothetical protein